MQQARSFARRAARPAAIVLGVGTFLALLGPFGSVGFGWPLVWIYWTGLIALGAVFGYGTGELAPRLLPRAPEWSIYLLCVAAVSVPMTGAVVFLNATLGDEPVGPGRLALTYFFVLVISGFVTAVVWTVGRLTAPQAAAAAAPAAARALTDKLPHRLRRAAILSMTSEDHYLRVRTEAGEALILMRLSDAIAAAEALDGARTHRSWWVARHAVTDARKGDGRGVLILSDGTEAPVSRSFYTALREAGWF